VTLLGELGSADQEHPRRVLCQVPHCIGRHLGLPGYLHHLGGLDHRPVLIIRSFWAVSSCLRFHSRTVLLVALSSSRHVVSHWDFASSILLLHEVRGHSSFDRAEVGGKHGSKGQTAWLGVRVGDNKVSASGDDIFNGRVDGYGRRLGRHVVGEK